mmetsp:Transcript_100265/g.323518  ORF Transcript_100265/g.323518 Transcript_100265/m.323518 type:complete len:139 (-) Transcript_100265:164-580(-)
MAPKVMKRPAACTKKKRRAWGMGLVDRASLQELLNDLEPKTEGRIVVRYACVQRDNVLGGLPTDDKLTQAGEETYELKLPDSWEYHGDMGPWQQRSGVFVGPPETVIEAKAAIEDLYARYVSYGCVSTFEADMDVRPL